MLMSPPPGSPYHRLARTPVHRWWRPVLGTLFLVVAALVMMIGLVGVSSGAAWMAGRPDGPDGIPTFGALTDTALGFVAIALVLPLILVAVIWIQRRPVGTISSVTGALRWRWLLICLPVALVAILLFLSGGLLLSEATGVDAGLGDPLAGWGPFLTSAAVLVLVVPFQAAAEEYLCRGWLLQGLGVWFRGPWLPIVAQAAVFAALHGWGTPFGFADLLLFGVVAGWVTVRTGGLEAAIALHVVNNLVTMVVAAAYGQLTVEETAADMPWQLAVADAPVLIGFGLVIVWLARRRALPSATPIASYDLVAGAR
ncbi:CPBP family intramembrane metalloprotease [Actinoplanes sp. NEAU-A12]|uniref:CPBP family intramembrane metalloprotease n=1 Tax=Actinoplanes sandaracinus TaxID=3045177 RepID=A0ABT6WSS9_9ACTN|nr:CPBP family intramembrane glutamic endopeptidase [Actinoplanes sandaracinus]MDI6102787.1 CPBP family intramembrane metalloprotease [Actinoplanes sandaracinus]